MKLFSKIRYFIAVLLVLVSVSGITSPSRGTGIITTLNDPFPFICETR
ncbi:hypothetical protein [Clostridium sp. KNHs205]|nr:hypothetical protein [Clostridium sp. KNHs205]